MNIRHRFSNAFTIVELLVVITVIGILAGIVVVSYGGSQKQANKSSINATAQQVKLKLGDFYTDNNYFPSKKGSSTSDSDSVLNYLSSINSANLATAFNDTYTSGSTTNPKFNYYACALGTDPGTWNGTSFTSGSCASGSGATCNNTSVKCMVYAIVSPTAVWSGYSTDSPVLATGP